MTDKLSVVNIDDLKEIMDNDMELIQECFADFLGDFPGQINGLKQAVDTRDAEKVNADAHKLKGTLRYLAAEAAADAAQNLELCGKQNDFSQADQRLADLEKECQRLINYIDQF